MYEKVLQFQYSSPDYGYEYLLIKADSWHFNLIVIVSFLKKSKRNCNETVM